MALRVIDVSPQQLNVTSALSQTNLAVLKAMLFFPKSEKKNSHAE
jgi:hypothetical protein